MASTQHSRYSLSIPQSSRDEAVRLPSIKDLNFHYARRHSSQSIQPHSQNPSLTPADSPVHPQENPVRWTRPNIQTQSSPPPPTSHIQHQQHQQHPHQQQHTPPLSAGHELHHKNDYSSKQDGAFLTPGMPLSAQSTPVPGSVTIGPGTRGDEGPHSKRRRSSGNMNNARDAPSPHQAHYPHYANYPPAQQTQQAYPQMQPPMSHQSHTVQPPIEHAHNPQVAVPHPGYASYPHQQQHQQQQYMPTRVHPHAPPPQHQPAPANPYPSPAPLPPSQAPWEQPHQTQPPQHSHQPPAQIQHQPHTQPAHVSVPPHATHHHHPAHVITQHQPPPPPPPPPSQHHIQHQQQHQPQQNIPPPPQAHHTQQHAQPEPQQQQQQQQPQPQPDIQQPQVPYATRASIAPIDTRNQYPMTDRDRSLSTMSQIVTHCWELSRFASKYAGMRNQTPDAIPTPEELAEMSQRAVEVLRLLEEYRRLQLPEPERVKIDSTAVITPPDDHRPPKRPWEDMSQDENAAGGATTETATSFAEQQYPTPVDKAQSTAEQDMEIIRTKRATSTAGGPASAGQPKSKYRKRSRATPPGKCHSCNIRETPEWRRGPDGARTLCNACGLHYAKLQRKRDKQAGPNGEAPRIDLETLRASARAAEFGEKSHTRSKRPQQQSNEPTSPIETSKPPPPPQHHQGSFQVVPMMTPDSSASSTSDPGGRVSGGQQQQQQPSHPAMQQQQLTSLAPTAPPPWSTSVQSSAPGARGYAPPDQLQHQSFMRTTHQATNHTSPR